MLLSQYTPDLTECGCDEAGRGCLAGAVFAAAVILPKDYHNEQLNDSKQLSEHQRYELRKVIEQEAVDWAVASVSAEEIDKTNILRASMHAMNLAVEKLKVRPIPFDSSCIDTGQDIQGRLYAATAQRIPPLWVGQEQGIPHSVALFGTEAVWPHTGTPHDIQAETGHCDSADERD